MLIYDGDVTLTNNTLSQNHCFNLLSSQGAGLTLVVLGFASGANNIIYGNTALTYPEIMGAPTFTYSCCSQTLSGTGNLTSNPLFVTGPRGGFYLSQVAAGQSVTSPCVDHGNPAFPMITGTTRTDEVQDASIVDMGYHYTLAASPPVTVTLTPFGTPIVIPPGGGSFNFNVAVANTGATPQTMDAWGMLRLPNNQLYGPVLGPVLNLTLPGSGSLNRNRTQNIPGSAPAGIFKYIAAVGDYVAWQNWTILVADSFSFSKSAVDVNGLVTGWEAWGEPFETALVFIPSDHSLSVNVSPNPFNSSTVISYKLQASSHVSLKVYDTAGRLVASLVDGWREAGEHQVTFDGSKLPSGIYFARLTAGDLVQTQKLALMK